MGGRGANSGGGRGGGGLSREEKERMRNNIATHTPEENDRAARYFESHMESEKKYVDGLNDYIRVGHIKSANDPWYQGHLNTYNSLKAQFNFFQSERKRQGR